MSSAETPLGGRYGRLWDAYVDEWPAGTGRRSDVSWPGDEWGTPAEWPSIFARLCPSVATWSRVLEIGPGSGKFTAMILERSEAEVIGYDVSTRYLGVCAERLATFVHAGRLHLHQIDAADPASMLDSVTDRGWRGALDAVVSIDSMVHVDLQYLIGYLVSAGLLLRAGGELVLTLGNATSEAGFAKLLRDVRIVSLQQASLDAPARRFAPPGFAWSSPDLISSVLHRLGFEVTHLGAAGRDIELRAVLGDPTCSGRYERFLRQ